jgi:hypothetical protein
MTSSTSCACATTSGSSRGRRPKSPRPVGSRPQARVAIKKRVLCAARPRVGLRGGARWVGRGVHRIALKEAAGSAPRTLGIQSCRGSRRALRWVATTIECRAQRVSTSVSSGLLSENDLYDNSWLDGGSDAADAEGSRAGLSYGSQVACTRPRELQCGIGGTLWPRPACAAARRMHARCIFVHFPLAPPV